MYKSVWESAYNKHPENEECISMYKLGGDTN